MKNKIIILTATMVLFLSTFFHACKKNDNAQSQSLTTKLELINKRYEPTPLELELYQNAAMDPAKVKILRAADEAGAISWGRWWYIPIVGAYGGLWNAFLQSKAACTWCPQARVIHDNYEAGNQSTIEAELAFIESKFFNSNTSSFNNFGFIHNRLMLAHAESNNAAITNLDGLTTFGLQLINQYTPLTSLDRDSLIGVINNHIINSVTNLNNQQEDERIEYAIANSNHTLPVKEALTIIESGINSYHLFNIDSMSSYIRDIEDTIFDDNSITEQEKNELFIIISILKYSHSFWFYADSKVP